MTAKNTSDTGPKQELAPIISPGFWEGFNWHDFFCYGALWCVMFFAVVCAGHLGRIYRNQQNQIQDLIERLNRYENSDNDFQGDSDGQKDYQKDRSIEDPLAAWVTKNLPTRKTEERAAVAEVFANLADMLEAGELTGENDTFAEGIAQLQPVATRSVWLPFLTKLTKRLKAAKLDSAGLAAACRTVSNAIYSAPKKPFDPFATSAPYLLLEGVKNISATLEAAETPSDAPEAEPGKLPAPDAIAPQNVPEEPKTEDKPESAENPPETEEKNAETSCPNGNCPAQQTAPRNSYGSNYGYGNYYGGYGWRYW